MPLSFYDLDLDALHRLMAGWGYGLAAARDVWRAVYVGAVASLDDITAFNSGLKARFTDAAPLEAPVLVTCEVDPGGEARKDLLRLRDGNQVEVVLLHYRERRSVCVSTQIGCACGCVFCATGQSGFVRNLSSGEIVGQVMHAQRAVRASGRSLTNVVLMGMGEPLLNYEPTVDAIWRLSDQRGLALPQRRITLSTIGIPGGIRRLAREGLQIGLAVSLHAASDELRDALVPINRRYPLDEVAAAMRDYSGVTQGRVMIEWTLISGVNDTLDQARCLVRRLDGIPAHVNLITLNETEGYREQPPTGRAVDEFAAVLDGAGVPHTVRQRRGAAIAAGCGQLRARRSDRVSG